MRLIKEELYHTYQFDNKETMDFVIKDMESKGWLFVNGSELKLVARFKKYKCESK